jgi:excinuclease ABC subunit A
MSSKKFINIRGAKVHNLKDINLKVPRDQLVVITGLSGSGKSSLAFDTIYAEGQRRYVESLSSYARQFIGIMDKPEVDYIDGLSPAISIDQKSTSRNPRSTVGTVTEIYDYLRLLYARIGKQKCYKCNEDVKKYSPEDIINFVLKMKNSTKIIIMSPIARKKKKNFKNILKTFLKEGFIRARINGEIEDIASIYDKLSLRKFYTIEIVIDRIIKKENIYDRLIQSIELAYKVGEGSLIINDGEKDFYFSENAYCFKDDISYNELQPSNFSFNSPLGACKTCDGLGTSFALDPDLIIPNINKSLRQGCIEPLGIQPNGKHYGNLLLELSDKLKFSFSDPWKNLPSEYQHILLYGSKQYKWEGVIKRLKRRYHQSRSTYIKDWVEKYMNTRLCVDCKGARVNEAAQSTFVQEKNIHTLTTLPIKDLHQFIKNLKLNKTEQTVSNEILKEIKNRLQFLINVGLNYLNLSRSSRTLSGGEMQRIRLATQIGSQLVGVLYVLDEPSIGLHARDNEKLINTLIELSKLGNTVLVVEHDEQMMKKSDWIIDLGPGAGVNGGNIVAEGTPDSIIKNRKSVTGQFLSGKQKIKIPNSRRNGSGKFLILSGASGNNLQSVKLNLPLGCFISITGVSGSGKSTLINQTLLPILNQKIYSSRKKPLNFESIEGVAYLDKVVNIDQSPIGKTPRSNPATYTGIFNHVRELYSQLPDSKIMGYKPGRFSFNVKGGRCEHCQGAGLIKIEMHFLSDVYITCEHCKGKRFNSQTLQIKYKNNNIFDILNMTVEEALLFFKQHKSIFRKLKTLCDVGLGYIRLGQQATTLSGGESQRVKLSSELSKVSTSKTLYILDEPTTGLHFKDVDMLISVLNNLVDKGNTVLVIEHNLDVVKCTDWIIDIGPEGGDGGGQIMATGTPESVIKIKKSYTGKFLKPILV